MICFFMMTKLAFTELTLFNPLNANPTKGSNKLNKFVSKLPNQLKYFSCPEKVTKVSTPTSSQNLDTAKNRGKYLNFFLAAYISTINFDDNSSKLETTPTETMVLSNHRNYQLFVGLSLNKI